MKFDRFGLMIQPKTTLALVRHSNTLDVASIKELLGQIDVFGQKKKMEWKNKMLTNESTSYALVVEVLQSRT